MSANVKLQLAIPEIYDKLCKKCRKKLRMLIQEKITDEMVSSIVGDKKHKGGGKQNGD